MEVFVVCAPGWDDDFQSVGVFSSYQKAKDFVDSEEYTSWAIEEHTVDEVEG